MGSVSVGSSANAAWTPKAVGKFILRADEIVRTDCQVTLASATCQLWGCAETAYQPAPTPKTLNAGTVRVAGPTQSVELVAGADGIYRQDSIPTPFWTTGDTLTASIGGSADFSAMTVPLQAPPPLVVTAPTPPTDGPLTIDRTQDLALAWTEPLTGSVLVAISVETSDAEGSAPIVTPGIDCEFPASAGGGLIPAVMLGAIANPTGLVGYYLDAVTYSFNDAIVNDAWVDFRATWVGLSTAATVVQPVTGP